MSIRAVIKGIGREIPSQIPDYAKILSTGMSNRMSSEKFNVIHPYSPIKRNLFSFAKTKQTKRSKRVKKSKKQKTSRTRKTKKSKKTAKKTTRRSR